MKSPQSVAVIGAGIAGLTAAARLRQAGCPVTVIEKSRGPGGRAATRRDGDLRFDHGAQYFTCKSAEFIAQIEGWLAAGTIAPWPGRIIAIEADGDARPVSSELRRFVGVPGMNAVARQMAQATECVYRQRVTDLRWSDGWRLKLESGATHTADAVVLTAPPAQSATLLKAVAPQIAATILAVAMEPCWALMLAFDRPPDPGFDAAFVNHGPLGWIAANHSKPGRPEDRCWVAHATGPWSAANLEMPPSKAARVLLAEFAKLTGIDAPPTRVIAHRWRYAKAVEPLTCRVLADPERNLVVAGDWCAGSRMEGAWLSGRAAAEALLSGR